MIRIYIGNLSFSTTEEALTEKFQQFGAVLETKIITDKFTNQSKGFGFINMEDEDAAFNAIRSINGTDIDGRKVRVSVAEEKGPRTSNRNPKGRR